MNHLFPNFDFSSWLTDFYLTCEFLSSPDPQKEDSSLEKEKFLEMVEHFDYQIHCHYDEERPCLSCSFIKILNNFNEFMALVSLKETRLDKIIGFFLRIAYPSILNHSAIAKTLTYKVKGYSTIDKHGKSLMLPSYIVTNIQTFLKKINIILVND